MGILTRIMGRAHGAGARLNFKRSVELSICSVIRTRINWCTSVSDGRIFIDIVSITN